MQAQLNGVILLMLLFVLLLYKYSSIYWFIWRLITNLSFILVISLQQIEGSRTKLLEHLTSSKTRDVSCVSSNASVADGQSSNYFKILEAFPEIMTVFYEDPMENISNVLRRNYYNYMSNDCNLMEINSKGGNYFGRKHYGAECRKTFHDMVIY